MRSLTSAMGIFYMNLTLGQIAASTTAISWNIKARGKISINKSSLAGFVFRITAVFQIFDGIKTISCGDRGNYFLFETK